MDQALTDEERRAYEERVEWFIGPGLHPSLYQGYLAHKEEFLPPHVEVTAKRIVEEYLSHPSPTQWNDEWIEKRRIAAVWGYHFAKMECPILLPGEQLPTDSIGRRRWLTYSTESWAQKQPGLRCNLLVDPTHPLHDTDEFNRFLRGIPISSVSVSEEATIIRKDLLLPSSLNEQGNTWPHREFYLGTDSFNRNLLLSAVISQWVEEEPDKGAFAALLDKSPLWQTALQEMMPHVSGSSRQWIRGIRNVLQKHHLPSNPSVVDYAIYSLVPSGERSLPCRGCIVTTFVAGLPSELLTLNHSEHISEQEKSLLLDATITSPACEMSIVQTVALNNWIRPGFLQRAKVDAVLKKHREWVNGLPDAILGQPNKRTVARSGGVRKKDALDLDIEAFIADKMTKFDLLAQEVSRRIEHAKQVMKEEGLGLNADCNESTVRQDAWRAIRKRLARRGRDSGSIPPRKK
jgi:hypothetical protein